jgi:hypothetical protein
MEMERECYGRLSYPLNSIHEWGDASALRKIEKALRLHGVS